MICASIADINLCTLFVQCSLTKIDAEIRPAIPIPTLLCHEVNLINHFWNQKISNIYMSQKCYKVMFLKYKQNIMLNFVKEQTFKR